MRIALLLSLLSLTAVVALLPCRNAVNRSKQTDFDVRRTLATHAKPSHVAGIITGVTGTRFEILAGSGGRRPNIHQGQQTGVRFDSSTVFLDSIPGDLEPGRDVDIIGVELESGDLLAMRVVIYEGDCAVRTPDGAILFHARGVSEPRAGRVLLSPCGSGAGII